MPSIYYSKHQTLFHGPEQVARSTQLPEEVSRSLHLGAEWWRGGTFCHHSAFTLGPCHTPAVSHLRATMSHVSANTQL